MEEQIDDLLKKLTGAIENIHDNYGAIQSIERQKKTADPSLLKALDEQIEEVRQVLKTNQKNTNAILEKICSLADSLGPAVSKDCKKLYGDYQKDQSDPDLLMIQEDIDLIKKDLKGKNI